MPEKRKWCFYLGEDLLIVEVFVCYQLSEIDKYFLGSEIETPDDALVFDNTGTVLLYLDGIIRYKKANFNKIQQQKAEYHITNFQNRFEAMFTQLKVRYKSHFWHKWCKCLFSERMENSAICHLIF